MNILDQLMAAWARGRIGTRLMASFAVVLVLSALVGLVGVAALSRVHGEADQLANKWMPSLGALSSTHEAVVQYRDWQIKHTAASDDGYRAEYQDKMTAALADIHAGLAAYRKLADAPGESMALDALDKKLTDYLLVAERVVKLGQAQQAADAAEISDGAGKMAHDEVLAGLDKMIDASFEGGQASAAASRKAYEQGRGGTLGLLACSLVVGLLLAAGITRSLLGQLGGEPAAAAAVARAVADGDLDTRIVLRAGDTTSLMACLRDMQRGLSRVVSTVREGSEHVATASAEIARGNVDLSSRTEQQASALQQTASSMDQLGSTVTQNADNSRQADSLARAASEVAVRGGAVVGQVVETMRAINESSRKIAEITSVIDGIAFQTNILALNAAVEAARAGEQGRGFAVVAGEVRILAQRSADAAREIKSLIAASVERVEQGTLQVDQAGETMQRVVTSVEQVSQIVNEISAASHEQSAGVRQVGEAITQMDHGTQQNAALVEQSAAAAQSLQQQADQLVRAVAVFKLNHAAV